jgi:photosystem II stability/assembly factor-like uncharacterized protein
MMVGEIGGAQVRTMIRNGIVMLALGCAVSQARAQLPDRIVRTEQTSGTSALLIAVSPVNDNIVWVSGAAGTWLRTVDGGTTWQSGRVAGGDSLQFRDVHAVSADTAYLLSIGSGAQSRIYKTTNGGRDWTMQFKNAEPEAFYDCFDFWDAQRGVVIGDAVNGKISMLLTTDGGAHWNHVDPATLPAAPEAEGSFAASGTCVETLPGGHAWIVASNPQLARLLHTADYGRTWSVTLVPITTRGGAGPQSVTFFDERNGMVLGGGYPAQPEDQQAAITVDGGRIWTPRTRPPLARGFWGGTYIPGAIPPTVVAVGPDGAVYSRDNGATWMQIDSYNYWSVGFASPRAGWIVGMGGRITKLSGF